MADWFSARSSFVAWQGAAGRERRRIRENSEQSALYATDVSRVIAIPVAETACYASRPAVTVHFGFWHARAAPRRTTDLASPALAGRDCCDRPASPAARPADRALVSCTLPERRQAPSRIRRDVRPWIRHRLHIADRVCAGPGDRNLLPRVAALAFGGGLLADVFKMLVARTRPRDFDLAGSILDTFGPLFPLGKLASGEQGFPSAHMATAFGLTAGLIWLYPRGRWLFPLFAILAGLQPIERGALSERRRLGAAAGCISASLFLPGGLLASWFERLEAWLGSRSQRADERDTAIASSNRHAESQRSGRAA